ncbi:MAG: peptide ABC transporter substrate-binding protein [Simkania negevensis]|nr:peptide ABC transporter substrate-binding protein [Simkania negevensis]
MKQLKEDFLSSEVPSSSLKGGRSFLSEKENSIQKELLSRVDYHKQDEGLLDEMDRCLSFFTTEFIQRRSALFISNIIAAFYAARKELNWQVSTQPNKRHIKLFFFKETLTFTFGDKSILGCVVGINLKHEYESFHQKHLLASVRSLFPEAELVLDTTYIYHPHGSPIRTFYVEFEKREGGEFSENEIDYLEHALVNEMKERVEALVPEIFTVRNEEEIMRSILILSKEVKNADDLPQVMIVYDRHDNKEVTFNVILLRVIKDSSLSLTHAFSKVSHLFTLKPDRSQIVSYINTGLPIEANVFRLHLPNLSRFLRKNFSLDFYQARKEVGAILTQAFGEIRDYNGGMLLKQGERLSEFKQLFPEMEQKDAELLESFFYSLRPIEVQATIALRLLESFFRLFLYLFQESPDLPYHHRFHHQEREVFFFIRFNHLQLKQAIEKEIKRQNIPRNKLILSELSQGGSHYIGYIYQEGNRGKQELFCAQLIECVGVNGNIKEKILALNLALGIDLFLDPRIGGDHQSSVINKMLFDGLMRLNEKGMPIPSCALSYEISHDLKKYVFRLKKSYWSNGMRLTAYDFEYAWKKILTPSFNTRFAYLFYPIKNAKKAKEGQASLENVGIKSIDDFTFEVTLEHPAPYFLELTAHTLFSPVNSIIDQKRPNWPFQQGKQFVCNGPFMLKNPHPFYAYELERTFQMFKEGQLDWMGPPLGATHLHFNEFPRENYYLPTCKMFWYFLNLRCYPFHNRKIRQAFFFATVRQEFINELKGKIEPAFSPLPHTHTQVEDAQALMKESKMLARSYFKEGLKELKIKREDFPSISILHYHAEYQEKVTSIFKKQIEETLGIQCHINICSFSDLFEILIKGNFQVGALRWIAWVSDPIYTLNIFRSPMEKMNFSKWTNEEFTLLLHQADQETDAKKRLSYLEKAERILMNDYFILPLYYESEQVIKQPNLEVPLVNHFGTVDFSYSTFHSV